MIRAMWVLLGWKGTLLAVAALLAALVGWGQVKYWSGYSAGRAALQAQVDAERDELQAKVFELADDLSENAAALAKERADRAKTVEALEDEAMADNPDSRVPSAASLRRLERRWNGN